MGVTAQRGPEIVKATSGQALYDTPIAIIGSGPAGVSCATFLARLGYRKIDIYESKPYTGGLSASEIPQYRLAAAAVQFEIDLLHDLGGVTIHTNAAIGSAQYPDLKCLPRRTSRGPLLRLLRSSFRKG